MDPLWIGVIGTGIGAFAGSGVPAVVQALTARGQRRHDAEQARLQREAESADAEAQRGADAAAALSQREFEEAIRRRQFAAELLPERRAKIEYWRENLFEASRQQRQFLGPDDSKPNVVGERWFEELRPYLTGEAADYCCDVETVRIENYILGLLSDEITRIEREWIAEAQG
ncbi:hypothetical protein [Mycolicibacterium cosmeticum]|uniref:hypothetical protein n=1 Tax=Mycolicibacterium cosmeticum TaxID=258533 RepID=UPI003204B2C7